MTMHPNVEVVFLFVVATLAVIDSRRVAAWSMAWEKATFPPLSRRSWCTSVLSNVAGVNLLVGATKSSAEKVNAADELPLALRDFTKLAPLGTAKRSTDKTLNLTLDELADRLSRDLLEGSTGQGGYLLTGDISLDVFRDDCVFVDPTNRVASLSQCQNALRILFDPARSQIRLLEPLSVDPDERIIRGKFRVRGFLQFPWKPFITAYESNIVYRVDEDGLVYEQEQSWSKSASTALKQSFTPTLFTPPPASTLKPSSSEPPEVRALFNYVNGRRPDEYSQEERFEVADLIEGIVNQRYAFKQELLPGKWMLVYLQPGPDGAGIDRRVPFPEFSFNDNYQVFGRDRVTNIGELFGPLADVRVFGGLAEVDPDSLDTPKRLSASIEGGKLCWREGENCIDLPISGEGLFDSVYLGERLRIGQNLNGGGARVVQVRLDDS